LVVEKSVTMRLFLGEIPSEKAHVATCTRIFHTGERMSRIQLHIGPMFSGKSTALLTDIERRLIGKQEPLKDFLVFNFHQDNRYGEKVLASHKDQQVTAIPLSSSRDLLNFLVMKNGHGPEIKPEFRSLRAIYLDEAQFFDTDLPKTILAINDLFFKIKDRLLPVEIMVAGLDLDFRGEPFGPVPGLLAFADTVTKHVAVCTVCGENNATRTQRLINGKPARFNDEIILIGADEAYTARCARHHEVPGRPEFVKI